MQEKKLLITLEAKFFQWKNTRTEQAPEPASEQVPEETPEPAPAPKPPPKLAPDPI